MVRGSKRVFLLLAGLLLAGGATVSKVQAQQGQTSPPADTQAAPADQQPKYKTIPRAILDSREAKRLKPSVRDLRTAGSLTQEQQRQIQRYYGLGILAPMTMPDALDSPTALPERRAELMEDLDDLGASPAHDYLMNFVFQSARAMVGSGYHPACRYNAMLVLGDLNQREAEGIGSSRRPAVPHAGARQFILRVAASPRAPESLRVAALIGLRRHARLLMADGKVDGSLVGPLTAIVQQQQPAAGGTRDGLHWMQMLAIETLAEMRAPEFANLFAPVVADPARPLFLRCAAARAIGKLNLGQATNLDRNQLAQHLAKLAFDACKTEIERVRAVAAARPAPEPQFGEPRIPAGINGVDAAATGPAVPQEADPLVTQSRRQLKHQLGCARVGLLNLAQAGGQSASGINQMIQHVDAILNSLDNNPASLTPDELVNRLGPLALNLQSMLQA